MPTPEYENSLCSKGYYSVINKVKTIACLETNEICAFQRYCDRRLCCVHTSGVLSCIKK